MPAGRPSEYRPEYIGTALEVLSKGHSVLAVAATIGVAKSTIYRWMDDYPEFRDAIKEGQDLAAAWWEARLIELAQEGKGNVTAAIFGLKNRAADEWRDVNRVEQTGADGGAIKHDHGAATERLASFLNDRSSKPGG